MKFKNIAIIADKTPEAQNKLNELCIKYELLQISDKDDLSAIDVIVALGGDGFMLHILHDFIDRDIPIYGINCGTIGFLMNENKDDNLLSLLEHAGTTKIHPLKMIATSKDGSIHEKLAINEVSLLRKTGQAAKIKISIDNVIHMQEIVCDGIIISTPAGSSAYNCSAGGPILPINSDLLALTPISPFRPRRWKGALLPHKSIVRLDILKDYKRPVNAVADFNEICDVVSVEVSETRSISIKILFDKGHSLEERIITEQFSI